MGYFSELMSYSRDPELLYEKYGQVLRKLFSQDVLREVPEDGDPDFGGFTGLLARK